jgi:hypothetical protein
MGRSKPIKLGRLSFATQQAALAHYQEILHRVRVFEAFQGNDLADAIALLMNHPSAVEKIGPGIKQLYVGLSKYGERCFHVKRIDGSMEDFSYRKCIAGNPSAFTDFSAACREAVAEDVSEFKRDYFRKHANADGKVRCPETGDWMALHEAQVDHPLPLTFSVIVKTFLAHKKLAPETVLYVNADGGGSLFSDAALSAEFRAWHKQVCHVRVITAERNQAKAGMARVKPTKADHKLDVPGG